MRALVDALMQPVFLAMSFPFENGEIFTGVGLIVWALLGSVLAPQRTRLRPTVAAFIALAGCCAILDRMMFPIAHTLIAIIGILLLLGAAFITVRWDVLRRRKRP
jgi:CHASE2 domain-containing sensor protein